ncbi:peroxidase 5-like [Phoenix dactylifera]|uniref:Peroxidase n=1 Tax=Phoenix dactylifera TaxID=42345 RepID=A0A8B7CLE7_PHODC|nr:peroxidase 5-like [Phoenix dactylifera]
MAPATLLFFLIFVQSANALNTRRSELQLGFYNSTCPDVEQIVHDVVRNRHFLDPTIAAGLIRLHFHDCFVRGCDASILLDETPSGEPVEKVSVANGYTLHGIEVIDTIKSIIESFCPGTVSCADILAFAARDAAVLAGLQHYPVPSGRRDGTVSRAVETLDLPGPFATVEQLTRNFAKKGFSQSEMVVLSGAHSIGGAHCPSFSGRLYNYTAALPQDPTIETVHAEYLKTKCPDPRTTAAEALEAQKVNFIPAAGTSLDGSYYAEMQMGKGLLASDQVLMTERRTRTVVERMAADRSKWARKFAKAMSKMGLVEVLTGDQGEVRRDCRLVN